MIISKFGGTSLSCAENMKKVKDIVLSNTNRKVIVVSAPGKCTKADIKITDLLYSAAKAQTAFSLIAERFEEIMKELKINLCLQKDYAHIEKQLASGATSSAIASRGEYLCAKIMAEYLNYEFIDAVKLIRFSSTNSFNLPDSMRKIRKYIKKGNYVVPGFYGAQENGQIQTFARGGSDLTGAVLAAALQAEKYENWTDVNGVYSADPNTHPNAVQLPHISYKEMEELAASGANVLMKESIYPAMQAGIPIHILNTFNPNHLGTIIS